MRHDLGCLTADGAAARVVLGIREHSGRYLDPAQARVVTEAMNLVITTLGGTPDTPDATSAIDNLRRVVGAES